MRWKPRCYRGLTYYTYRAGFGLALRTTTRALAGGLRSCPYDIFRTFFLRMRLSEFSPSNAPSMRLSDQSGKFVKRCDVGTTTRAACKALVVVRDA